MKQLNNEAKFAIYTAVLNAQINIGICENFKREQLMYNSTLEVIAYYIEDDESLVESSMFYDYLLELLEPNATINRKIEIVAQVVKVISWQNKIFESLFEIEKTNDKLIEKVFEVLQTYIEMR